MVDQKSNICHEASQHLLASEFVISYINLKAKKTHGFNSCIAIRVYALYISSIKKATEYGNHR